MRALAWEPMVPFSWDIGEGLKLRQPHEVLYLSPRLSINFLLHQVLAQAWLNKDHKDYQKHRQMFINVAKVVDCPKVNRLTASQAHRGKAVFIEYPKEETYQLLKVGLQVCYVPEAERNHTSPEVSSP